MLKEIAHDNYSLLSYKPNEGSWSILEVVEHCKNIETSILYSLIKYKDYPSRNLGIKEALSFGLLKLAMFGGFKFKVPPIPGLFPGGKASPNEISVSWNDTRKNLVAYLESFPHDKIDHSVFKHPRTGYINIVQTIDFINDHTLHHQKQIKRIQKSFLERQK